MFLFIESGWFVETKQNELNQKQRNSIVIFLSRHYISAKGSCCWRMIMVRKFFWFQEKIDQSIDDEIHFFEQNPNQIIKKHNTLFFRFSHNRFHYKHFFSRCCSILIHSIFSVVVDGYYSFLFLFVLIDFPTRFLLFRLVHFFQVATVEMVMNFLYRKTNGSNKEKN